MDWLTLIGICLVLFAAYYGIRSQYYGTVAVGHRQQVTLRNGDKIACSVSIRIEGGPAYSMSLVIPFLASQEEGIRGEATAMATAIISRWALEFESAAVATEGDCPYDLLKRDLNRWIESPNFAAVKADVTAIEVISLAERPPEPKPTRADKIVASLDDDKQCVEALDSWAKDNPALAPLIAGKLGQQKRRIRTLTGWSGRPEPRKGCPGDTFGTPSASTPQKNSRGNAASH